MEELFWLNYPFFCCISDWKQSQKMKRNLKIFQYWKNSLLNNKLKADKICQINSLGKKGPPVREKSDALNWKWCHWGRTAILLPFCCRPAHLHLTWEVTPGSFIVCLFSLSLSFELAMAINGIYKQRVICFFPKIEPEPEAAVWKMKACVILICLTRMPPPWAFTSIILGLN